MVKIGHSVSILSTQTTVYMKISITYLVSAVVRSYIPIVLIAIILKLKGICILHKIVES